MHITYPSQMKMDHFIVPPRATSPVRGPCHAVDRRRRSPYRRSPCRRTPCRRTPRRRTPRRRTCGPLRRPRRGASHVAHVVQSNAAPSNVWNSRISRRGRDVRRREDAVFDGSNSLSLPEQTKHSTAQHPSHHSKARRLKSRCWMARQRVQTWAPS